MPEYYSLYRLNGAIFCYVSEQDNSDIRAIKEISRFVKCSNNKTYNDINKKIIKCSDTFSGEEFKSCIIKNDITPIVLHESANTVEAFAKLMTPRIASYRETFLYHNDKYNRLLYAENSFHLFDINQTTDSYLRFSSNNNKTDLMTNKRLDEFGMPYLYTCFSCFGIFAILISIGQKTLAVCLVTAMFSCGILFLIFLLFTYAYYTYIINNKSPYKFTEWRHLRPAHDKKYIIANIYFNHMPSDIKKIKQSFEDNKILEYLVGEFSCSITTEIPKYLVFDKDFKQYEKTALEQSLKIRPKNIYTSEPMNIEHDVVHEEVFNQLLDIIRYYDAISVKNNDTNQEIKANKIDPQEIDKLIKNCVDTIETIDTNLNSEKIKNFAKRHAVLVRQFYFLALFKSKTTENARKILGLKLKIELYDKLGLFQECDSLKAELGTILENKIQTQVQPTLNSPYAIYEYYYSEIDTTNERIQVITDDLFARLGNDNTSETVIQIAIDACNRLPTDKEILILKSIVDCKNISEQTLFTYLPDIIKKFICKANPDWEYIAIIIERYIELDKNPCLTHANFKTIDADKASKDAIAQYSKQTTSPKLKLLYDLYDPNHFQRCYSVQNRTTKQPSKKEMRLYFFNHTKSQEYMTNQYYIKAVKSVLNVIDAQIDSQLSYFVSRINELYNQQPKQGEPIDGLIFSEKKHRNIVFDAQKNNGDQLQKCIIKT